MDETSYIQGSRTAWTAMLRTCLRNLDYESNDKQLISLIEEREAVIAQLREICEVYGDNDWDNTLHLGDVIEKHLGRHLHENYNAGGS